MCSRVYILKYGLESTLPDNCFNARRPRIMLLILEVVCMLLLQLLMFLVVVVFVVASRVESGF